MNRIFSLVWNRSRKQIEVASELARARKGSGTAGGAAVVACRTLKALVVALALAGCCGWAMPASAAPATDVALGIAAISAPGGASAGTFVDGSGALAVATEAPAMLTPSIAAAPGAAQPMALPSGGSPQTCQYQSAGQFDVSCGEGTSFGPGAEAIAVGHNASAQAPQSLAVGVNAVAGVTNGSSGPVAVGYGANALTGDSVAIGTNAVVTSAGAVNDTGGAAGVRGIAIGLNASTTMASSIAMGFGAIVQNTNASSSAPASAIAIGTGAAAMGNGSIAIGSGAGSTKSNGFSNVVVGIGSGQNIQPVLAANNGGVGVSGSSNTAFGNNSGNNVTGSSNAAFGTGAGNNVGPNTDTTQSNCSFAPFYCYAGGGNGTNNVAFGNAAGSTVAGSLNTGVGWRAGATVNGFNNVGIGPLAGFTVTGSSNVGIGSFGGAFVTGMNNAAVGNGAGGNVKGDSNSAFGNGAGNYVTGAGNLAFGPSSGSGTGTTALTVDRSIAVGNGAIGYGNDSMAMGTDAEAGAQGSSSTVIDGVAIGHSALAAGNGATAVGANSSASELYAVAVGNSASAGAQFAAAFGPSASANGNFSLAAGNSSTAFADNAVALGASAFTGLGADHAVALGSDASAYGQGSIAQGQNAVAGVSGSATTVVNDIAIGNGATAIGGNSIAQGAGATASNANDVALGSGSSTTAPSTGPYTLNGNAADIAATSDTNGVVSVGAVGKERQIQNVAAGTIASSSTDAVNGSQLYAVGNSLNNLGSSVADGMGGTSSYDPTTGKVTTGLNVGGTSYTNVNDALGAVNTLASEGWNITTAATGSGVANGTSVANVAPGGTHTLTAGNNLITTQSATDVAIGVNPVLTGLTSIGFSGGTTLDGSGLTIAGGPSITTSGINASNQAITNVAAGTNPTDAVNVSQLGSAVAGATTEVAAGTNVAGVVKTTGANGQSIYTVNANGASVSAGSSSVTVTAGSPDANNVTDYAVDLSAASKAQLDNAVQYDDGTHTSVTLGGAGASAPVALTNVADGALTATSTDAVNGSQLYGVQQLASEGWNLSANGGTGVNIKPGATVDVAQGTNVVVTQDATTGDLTIATSLTPSFTSVTTGDTVMDNGGVTVNDGSGHSAAIGATGVVVTGGANGPVSLTNAGLDNGGNQITNVAPGTAGTDAVNLDQLNAVSGVAGAGWNLSANGGTGVNIKPGATVDVAQGTNIVVTQDATTGDLTIATVDTPSFTSVTTGTGANTVVMDGSGITVNGGTNGPVSLTGTGLDNGGNKITNVAAGTAATDAVNVSQLDSTVAGAKTHYYSVNDGGTQGANYDNDGATGVDALAAGVGTSAAGASSTAIGAGAIAGNAFDVALGAGSVTGVANPATGVTLWGASYTFAGGNPQSVVSVGSVGNERQVTNVAAGRVTATSTDAVNGSQLYATNEAVTAIGTQVTTNTGDISNLQNQINTINQNGSGMFQVSADRNNQPAPAATGTNSAAGGAGATASGSDALAVGNDSGASGAGSTALGAGASATGDNSVALGAGSVATGDNTVSVGSSGHERQITNVAAGTAPTDAVNVSQLQQSVAGGVQYDTNANGTTDYNSVTMNPGGTGPTVIHNVGAGVNSSDAVNLGQLNTAIAGAVNTANNYTDQRYNELKGSMSQIGNRANAGIASAIASASLPQPYAPNQSSLGVGLGSFRGEAGIAVGLSKISESGRWILKANVNSDTRGDVGAGVGAGIVW